MKRTLAGIMMLLGIARVVTSCGGSGGSPSSPGDDAGGQDGTASCGASGDPCCGGTACNNGFTCSSGVCSGSSQPDATGSTDATSDATAGDDSGDSAAAADSAGPDARVDSSADGSVGDASADTSVGDAGTDAGTSDAASDACVGIDAGAPPYPQRCAPPTANECAGATDTFLTSITVNAALLNGSGGNGFDDDCDGLVDEGCACSANGLTKGCYLVPASQIDPSTHSPVGWCTTNSFGSLDCAGTAFPTWSGVCRGASPPFPDDVCAPGDFNCDGIPENSTTQNCACTVSLVTCPELPITEAPYPNPTTIRLIDGSQWIDVADRAAAVNWTWTVIGGDCDNVLPHPTYQIYKQTNSTAAGANANAAQIGVSYATSATPPRYVATAGAPLVALQAASFGSGIAGGQIYPAFGLSGDYIVQGEFDLAGQHYACTQKVQVRAPGIRAEACWYKSQDNDLDLHFARLQGVSCAMHGWEENCPAGNTFEDCWYLDASGCRETSTVPPGWGYADSATSACIGWSSKRQPGTQGCTNPRLDKDEVACDPAVTDPTNIGSMTGGFCGPENINLDNPRDGDAFVVGLNHYGNNTAGVSAKPHVNLYCNGERVLSVGYNPVTGQTSAPVENHAGSSTSGDWWNVATIKAHVSGGSVTSCDVATIPSHDPDPNLDGASQVCVESESNASTPPFSYTNHEFVEHAALQGVANGSIPVTPAQWCKH